MNIITYFTGSDNPGINRRAAVSVLLTTAIFIGIILFGSRANAAQQPVETAPSEVRESLAAEESAEAECLGADLTAMTERAEAAETERDALQHQLAEVSTRADMLQSQLDALQRECATSYVLRFRVERNVCFPRSSEILYFTRTVDAQTFDRWNNGDIVTEATGFLTVPGDGTLHEWVVVMEEKYITAAPLPTAE